MKTIAFFLFFLLFSTILSAKVKVLCLGEGECVNKHNNSVHPGSLSGASLAELQSFISFLTGMAIDEGIIVSSPPDTLDRDLLNGWIDTTNQDIAEAKEGKRFIDACLLNQLSNSRCPDFEATCITEGPISHLECPGYQVALDAACDGDDLFDDDCPGYQVAFDAACDGDDLFDDECPGYEVALDEFNIACDDDDLFDDNCPGYEVALDAACDGDDLFDDDCPGYQVALDAACYADDLFDDECPGYLAAIELAQELELCEVQIDLTETRIAEIELKIDEIEAILTSDFPPYIVDLNAIDNQLDELDEELIGTLNRTLNSIETGAAADYRAADYRTTRPCRTLEYKLNRGQLDACADRAQAVLDRCELAETTIQTNQADVETEYANISDTINGIRSDDRWGQLYFGIEIATCNDRRDWGSMNNGRYQNYHWMCFKVWSNQRGLNYYLTGDPTARLPGQRGAGAWQSPQMVANYLLGAHRGSDNPEHFCACGPWYLQRQVLNAENNRREYVHRNPVTVTNGRMSISDTGRSLDRF